LVYSAAECESLALAVRWGRRHAGGGRRGCTTKAADSHSALRVCHRVAVVGRPAAHPGRERNALPRDVSQEALW